MAVKIKAAVMPHGRLFISGLSGTDILSPWGFLLLATTAGFAKASHRGAGRWKAPRFFVSH